MFVQAALRIFIKITRTSSERVSSTCVRKVFSPVLKCVALNTPDICVSPSNHRGDFRAKMLPIVFHGVFRSLPLRRAQGCQPTDSTPRPISSATIPGLCNRMQEIRFAVLRLRIPLVCFLARKQGSFDESSLSVVLAANFRAENEQASHLFLDQGFILGIVYHILFLCQPSFLSRRRPFLVDFVRHASSFTRSSS